MYALRVLNKSDRVFRLYLSSKDQVLFKDLENYSNLKLKYLIFFQWLNNHISTLNVDLNGNLFTILMVIC